MNKSIYTLLIVSVALGVSGCGNANKNPEFNPLPKGAEVTEYEGMKLVWHDEFDVDGRLSDDWSYEKGFVRNNEHQWYQEDNCFVEDGALIIEARKETVENPNYDPESRDWRRSRKVAEYTSGSVNTRNSFTFKYGKLECRAKISVEKGSWPAIWTLGNQWGWPYGGEIDIMEYYLVRDVPTILANVAWGAGPERSGSVWRTTHHPLSRFLEKDPQWVEKYHVWTMDWTPEKIVLSLDGEVLNTVDLSESVNGGFRGNYENPFSNDYEDFGDYILLDYAIGGNNGGDPSESNWPQRYCIDYVRVYQDK